MKCEKCGKKVKEPLSLGATKLDNKEYECLCEICEGEICDKRREKAMEEIQKDIEKGIQDGRFKHILDIWINNKEIILKNAVKPCWVLEYCPYGSLVEYYPFEKDNNNIYSCEVFGHNCPVFYQAEPFEDESEEKNKEDLKVKSDKMFQEFEEKWCEKD